MAPGTSVKTPAAARTPQSTPEADIVFVIVTAIDLALTAVNVLLKSNSTQENIKQKNAQTPIPEAINGVKIFVKNPKN